MVASLFSMLFKCVSSWQEGVSLWLVICQHDTQKMFSHFTLVLESELSRCAWNVHQSCLTFRSIDLKRSAKTNNWNRSYSTKYAKVCHGGNPYPIKCVLHQARHILWHHHEGAPDCLHTNECTWSFYTPWEEVTHGLFTFNAALNSTYFLSLSAVHELHGRRPKWRRAFKSKSKPCSYQTEIQLSLLSPNPTHALVLSNRNSFSG